ncbi:MAG: hypothetical protein ACVCEJ_02900 [Candidatus Izemoplasmataceae bacterium]
MKEKSNFITGSLIRETYDSNKLIDRKILSECILNIEAWRELALQEKEIGIETDISITQRKNQTIINTCTKVIGETKVVYFHNKIT